MRNILDDILKDDPVLNETESRLVDFAEQLLYQIGELHGQIDELTDLADELKERADKAKYPTVTRGGYSVISYHDGCVSFRRSVTIHHDGVDHITTDDLDLDVKEFATAIDLLLSVCREQTRRHETTSEWLRPRREEVEA